MEGISAPPPYRIGEQKEWIVSDEPATAGFAILVRTAITNAEQNELRERLAYITGEYSAQWDATPKDERDLDKTPKILQRQLLARYVYDWNAEHPDVDGVYVKVPPPAINGSVAFDYITANEMGFILDVVQDGYRFLGKAVSWQKIFAAFGDSSAAKPPDVDPPQSEPTPIKSRKPRRNSSMPSKSASTGSQ